MMTMNDDKDTRDHAHDDGDDDHGAADADSADSASMWAGEILKQNSKELFQWPETVHDHDPAKFKVI